MGPMRAMACSVIDHVLLVVHGDEQPDDDEWKRFLSVYDARLDELDGVVVVTPGPAPDLDRRAQLNELHARRVVPYALLSDSKAARGKFVALSWMGTPVKAFDPPRVTDALSYLALAPGRHAALVRELDQLKLRVQPAARARVKTS